MNPVTSLRQILDTALGMVYPANCALTEKPILEDARHWVSREEISRVKKISYPLCLTCGKPYAGAMRNPRRCANCVNLELHFDSARAFARTEGVTRELIHRFKYGQSLWLRKLLGEWIVEGYQTHFADREFDAVIPTPIHPRKLRERGFNQALELARALGQGTGIRVLSCLERCRDVPTQTTFNRRKRFTNLVKSFKLSPKAKVQEMRLLLVDDVLTTGATASECARALKEGGAEEVHVLTLARG